MNSDKTTTIAYRCPDCGREIKSEVNIFQLSGNNFYLECGCGKSKLNVSLSHDGKVRLLVPCLACPHAHPYTLSSSMFFSRELFILQCSFSGMDICFIGKPTKVEEALEKSSEELLDLMDSELDEQFGIENQSAMREALTAIEDLAKANEIHCLCSEKGEKPQVAVVIDYDQVILTCKNCNARLVIPAKTNFDANNAIELDRIDLK
jgi:hypothetical protein